MNLGIWAGVAVVVALGWMYNRVVALRQRARGAWSDIDVQLKRRWDLIPVLTAAVKGAMDYEAGTLEAVVSARTRAQAAEGATPGARGREELALETATHTLLALVERYPDLTANTNVQQLQTSLVEIEDALQAARRYYNAVVRDFNALIATVPTIVVARLMGARELEYFQADAASRAAPSVNLEG